MFKKTVEDLQLKTILGPAELDSSTEEAPEEWSFLNITEFPNTNPKQELYECGLFDPGNGEVCIKQIKFSDSDVIRHPYYAYPAVLDPGIKKALLEPSSEPVYANDGHDLYLDLCKEMNIFPIRMFATQLFEKVIDLKYYGINPEGLRPMAKALSHNKTVEVLDLTDNFIGYDGCFHLGEMLVDNCTIKELNLSGCRIGPKGAERLLCNLHMNLALRKLNLSRNQLGDSGIVFLAQAITAGADVGEINISFNNLSSISASTLANAFSVTHKITHLNLSWNSLVAPAGLNALTTILANSPLLVEVNLSWNSLTPRFSHAIANLLLNSNLKCLNLSNNSLNGEAILAIKQVLPEAKKLETLHLSNNPLSPQDAVALLESLKLRKVKLKKLYLDNVYVTKEFLALRNTILNLKYKRNNTITYGEVKSEFEAREVDFREIVLRRAALLCSKPKKKAADIASVIVTIHSKHNKEFIDAQEFTRALAEYNIFQLDEDLIDGMVLAFPGTKKEKGRTLSLYKMVDYIHRLWPDKKPLSESETTTSINKNKYS